MPQTKDPRSERVSDWQKQRRLTQGVAQPSKQASQKNVIGLSGAKGTQIEKPGQNRHSQKWHIEHERIRQDKHNRACPGEGSAKQREPAGQTRFAAAEGNAPSQEDAQYQRGSPQSIKAESKNLRECRAPVHLSSKRGRAEGVAAVVKVLELAFDGLRVNPIVILWKIAHRRDSYKGDQKQ